jgi:phage portal protein BeeE
MTVAEKVIAALANLPNEQQTIVLDFVQSLNQKQSVAIGPNTMNDRATPNLETLRAKLKQVAGCMQNAPDDLSTNPAYMEEFGQ